MDNITIVCLGLLIVIVGPGSIFLVYKLSKKYYFTLHFKAFLYVIIAVNSIALLMVLGASSPLPEVVTTTTAPTTTTKDVTTTNMTTITSALNTTTTVWNTTTPIGTTTTAANTGTTMSDPEPLPEPDALF